MPYSPTSKVSFYNYKLPSNLSHITTDVSPLPAPLKEYENYKYIHLNAPIDVNCAIDDIINANYMSFINPNFGNKLIYAFIEDLTFLAAQTTRVHFKVDPWLTYRNDIVFKESFVEREHVSDDTRGLHTLPENLERGDYITIGSKADMFSPEVMTCVAVNSEVNISDTPLGGKQYAWTKLSIARHEGFVSANVFYAFDNNEAGLDKLIQFLTPYIADGKENNILGIILLNKAFIPPVSENGKVQNSGQIIKLTYRRMQSSQAFEGFVPKNNKLYTSPFLVMKWHNNNGSARYLAPQDQQVSEFTGIYGEYAFDITASMMNLAPVIKCSLISQKNHPDSDDHMTLSGFPQLSWNSNGYYSWLANNSGNIISQAAGVSAGIALAPLTGGLSLGASVAGALPSISSTVASHYDRSKQGSNAHGPLSASTVNVSDGSMTFSVQEMSIKKEYAEIIDNFFTMFGYQVNTLKVPNLYTRPIFNYIKTNGINIEGNIPQSALNELKNAFDNGVTVWHNVNNVYNYDLDNGV